MSTLDRAFIKAYQKQRVIPAPHVAFPPAEALDEIERARIDPTQNDAAPVEPKPVRAALEVEQFDWPETVETLRLASVDYFNAWSEQFDDGPGVTVLAASDARGAGRTTVLLAAARHLSLARPAARIALVDADFRHPELA
ncbi:MAG TPA: hypothetical protein VHB99_01750, partial [Pirellulales bacterium]|nr:hypothetical protein [Pirellulales bacterium]